MEAVVENSDNQSSLETITDEDVLRKMLDQSEDFELRRQIRSRLRELKKSKTDHNGCDSVDHGKQRQQQQKVVRPRETWATSTPVRKRDDAEGQFRTSKPSSTVQPLGGTTAVPTVSLRHVPETDVKKSRPQTTIEGAKRDLGPVALRPVSVNLKTKSSDTGKQNEFLQGVSLRKVDPVKIAVNDSDPFSRPTARNISSKSARERFKEIDAVTSASRHLTSGDTETDQHRRSPSPSGIRQAMLDWCRYRTVDYPNVDITDFSGSWSNGMAFCAIVHSFFPDAFDFDSLDPNNAETNLQLAFDTAQKRGDVYPLLDPEDIIQAGPNPDWKCIFTYVNSIYATLQAATQNKRTSGGDTAPGPADTAAADDADADAATGADDKPADEP